MSREGRAISGKKVALLSAMIVLVGLAPITVSSTMALTGKSLKRKGLVGVYWDSGCGSPVSSIVGSVEPGSSKDVVVYIRNEREGNSAVILYLETANWNPKAASRYITLSWDYGGQSISPGDVVPVVLTLSVSSDISGITNFNFDCVITGSG